MATRKSLFTAAGAMVAMGIALGACQHEEPNVIYMPDMVYSPALKAQEIGSMRLPVKGTVPRDYEPYPYRDVETAGRELKNPLQPTQTVLRRGKEVYNTYCIVCHGAYGEGDGTVVPKFPRPPTLQSDKIRNYADGSIYHVVTMGQNLMPSYASQVSPGDRWATIHYLRALQRAKHPTPDDLKAAGE
jgi:mono/diheme cytochrome c family protein